MRNWFVLDRSFNDILHVSVMFSEWATYCQCIRLVIMSPYTYWITNIISDTCNFNEYTGFFNACTRMLTTINIFLLPLERWCIYNDSVYRLLCEIYFRDESLLLQGCMTFFFKLNNHFVFLSYYADRRSNGTHSIYKRQTQLWEVFWTSYWVFNMFHMLNIALNIHQELEWN